MTNGYAYRGIRKISKWDTGSWGEVDEYYYNPHSRWYECILQDGRKAHVKPDDVGFQDGRIHVEYRADGGDAAWIEWDNFEKLWVLTGCDGALAHKRETACTLEIVCGYLPHEIFQLICAAVIKSRGYSRAGMEIHKVAAGWFCPDNVFPNILGIDDIKAFHEVLNALCGRKIDDPI